jgi:peptide/nickel transport system substrate-binding protein
VNKKVTKIGWIVLAALLCLSLILVPGCTTPAEQEEEEEPQIEIPYRNDGIFLQMIIGEPETLDPACGYDNVSDEQMDLVYETLVDWDREASAEFVAQLATEWEWSDADITWTFKIRKGVKFHEGGDLTPEDVEYSFERSMIYDRAGGPACLLFNPLLGVGAYEDTTFADVDAVVEVDGDYVVFTLADAAYKLVFLQTICGSWASIVDKEWCVANGEWDGTEADAPNHYQVEDGTTYLWTHMNGTGPWKQNEWDPGVQTKLERFDGYWGAPAPFDWVISQVVDEWTTRKQALLAGDADFVDVPRQYIGELEGIDDLTVYKDLPDLVVYGFFFVLDINPTSPYIGSGKLDGDGIPGDFFADPDVRKGFCYAFDYDTFIEDVYQGEAIQPATPVIQGLYGYNPDAQKYTFDMVKAEEHLRTAFDGQVWEKGFKFTMLYNAGNDMRKAACEILQHNLLELNPKFQVSILPLAWGTGILPLIKTKDATAYIIGWGADYPHADNFVYPFMHSQGVFAEYQSYGSPELDAKIMAALLETDPAQQLADYYEIQQIFYDDAPGFMVVQPTARRYFTKYIKGFYLNSMIAGNAGPLYHMTKSES